MHRAQLHHVDGVESYSSARFWPKDDSKVIGSIHVRVSPAVSFVDPGGPHSTVQGRYAKVDRIEERLTESAPFSENRDVKRVGGAGREGLATGLCEVTYHLFHLIGCSGYEAGSFQPSHYFLPSSFRLASYSPPPAQRSRWTNPPCRGQDLQDLVESYPAKRQSDQG